jgi:transcriptional regulator GlxA family with amidase domain
VATHWTSRDRLADRFPALKAIAGRSGSPAPGWLGHAFERRLGMAPSLFREMHRPAQVSAA